MDWTDGLKFGYRISDLLRRLILVFVDLDLDALVQANHAFRVLLIRAFILILSIVLSFRPLGSLEEVRLVVLTLFGLFGRDRLLAGLVLIFVDRLLFVLIWLVNILHIVCGWELLFFDLLDEDRLLFILTSIGGLERDLFQACDNFQLLATVGYRGELLRYEGPIAASVYSTTDGMALEIVEVNLAED